MSPARKLLTVISIAAWVLALAQLWVWWENDWDRYSKAHHCKLADTSDVWSYVAVSCPGCPAMPMTPNTYECDDGQRIEH